MNWRPGPGGLVLALALALVCRAALGTDAVRIYVDADRTGERASALSIERGIRTALDKFGGLLGGHPVELVLLDHRGSTRRSARHLETYLSDPRALAVYSGLHSPPLLAHRERINREEVLMLVPWAAAAPITRYPSGRNWVFRLSVDDDKAGRFIVRQAALRDGFRRPYLILEQTGWGRSNLRTMSAAIAELGDTVPITLAGSAWFNWDVGLNRARGILREAANAEADVILLVANASEAKTFARALLELPESRRLPVRSHWGVTGGDFAEVIDSDMRSRLDLAFIQTRYPFLDGESDEFETRVYRCAEALFPGAFDPPSKMQAPAGFVHAYDLTLLLAAAVEQAGLTGDIRRDRRSVRDALEALERPVRGLLKTYQRPYRPYDEADPDAHEALSPEDYVMAVFGSDGEVVEQAGEAHVAAHQD